MNACVHTNTKPQISSTRSRGLGWRIHGSVKDTKLSTNKQHTLPLCRSASLYCCARFLVPPIRSTCLRSANLYRCALIETTIVSSSYVSQQFCIGVPLLRLQSYHRVTERVRGSASTCYTRVREANETIRSLERASACEHAPWRAVHECSHLVRVA